LIKERASVSGYMPAVKFLSFITMPGLSKFLLRLLLIQPAPTASIIDASHFPLK